MNSHMLNIMAVWIPIILTGVYIWLTREMVKQMRSAREPSVYADLEADHGKCKIIVGNCGDSPAVNIRLAFLNPSPLRDVNNIPSADKTLAKQPITFLAPKSKLKFWAGYIDHNSQVTSPDLVVTIEYENEEKKKFLRICRINTLKLDNLLFETFRDPSHEIAEAIREGNLGKNFGPTVCVERDKNQEDRRQRIPCPICSEMVLLSARKCRYCQETINHVEAAL